MASWSKHGVVGFMGPGPGKNDNIVVAGEAYQKNQTSGLFGGPIHEELWLNKMKLMRNVRMKVTPTVSRKIANIAINQFWRKPRHIRFVLHHEDKTVVIEGTAIGKEQMRIGFGNDVVEVFNLSSGPFVEVRRR
mgnify:CR=1 FL=1